MALSGRAVATRNRNVRKAIRISRSMGSAALALSYVGNGRFDAFIQQGGLSAWDVAAAGLIAERGGARVTSIQGEARATVDVRIAVGAASVTARITRRSLGELNVHAGQELFALVKAVSFDQSSVGYA